LKREDFHTPTWKRLSKHVADRIDELRQLNDSMSLSVEKTAAIRGGISELLKILALADEASASPEVSPDELSALTMPPASNGQKSEM
jgi:hypothetical protein